MPSEILYALITWYISHLLVNERGPYAVFTRLRQVMGVDYDAYGNDTPRHELGRLFMCITCTSFWVACIIALATHSPWYLVLWYSGGSVLVNRYVEG